MSGRTTTLEQQAERIARRMAALGPRAPRIVPNSGVDRTPAKRELLKAIEDAARAKAQPAPFRARFPRA